MALRQILWYTECGKQLVWEVIQLAKKTIHSQKTVLGTTIHTDESNRIVGTSSKGLFGEEVFLDSNGRFAGTSAKASWARNTILTKMGILSRLPVTAFSEPRSQLIRTGNTWGRVIRVLDQIRSLSSMEKRMIRRSSILALLLVCSSLSSALSSLF